MADTFAAGVKTGGLHNREDIRVLVCYLLSRAGRAVPGDIVTGQLAAEGLANYFELADALDYLLRAGQIAQSGDGAYTATARGAATARLLESQLSAPLRQSALRATMRALALLRSTQENRAEVTKTDHGWQVTCSLHEGEVPWLRVSLLLPDKTQADDVQRHFLDDPARVYCAILGDMTGDYRSIMAQFAAVTAERVKEADVGR